MVATGFSAPICCRRWMKADLFWITTRPPGSSLTESDRILQHIEQILQRDARSGKHFAANGTGTRELAAVTEANRGDFTVKLKSKRNRDIDDIMNDVRGQVEGSEPAAKVEFVQVLQDMIGDLTNAPQPIVIKLFSQDPALLAQSCAACRGSHSEGARRGGCARWH